jgi:hypothetical protein
MPKRNGAGNRDRRGNRGETPLRERFQTLYEHAPFGIVMFYKDLDAGIEFLQKPFSPSELTQKAREVLDRDGR